MASRQAGSQAVEWWDLVGWGGGHMTVKNKMQEASKAEKKIKGKRRGKGKGWGWGTSKKLFSHSHCLEL